MDWAAGSLWASVAETVWNVTWTCFHPFIVTHAVSSFILSHFHVRVSFLNMHEASVSLSTLPPLPVLTLSCPCSPPGWVWPQRWREAGEVCVGGERWGMAPACDCISKQSSPSALSTLCARTLCLTYNNLPSPLPRTHPSRVGEPPENTHTHTPTHKRSEIPTIERLPQTGFALPFRSLRLMVNIKLGKKSGKFSLVYCFSIGVAVYARMYTIEDFSCHFFMRNQLLSQQMGCTKVVSQVVFSF